jgi:hypothetical protein
MPSRVLSTVVYQTSARPATRHQRLQHQINPRNRHSFRDNPDISDKKAIKGFCQKNCLKIWLDFKAD